MFKYFKKMYILYEIERANHNYYTITEGEKITAIVVGNKIFQ